MIDKKEYDGALAERGAFSPPGNGRLFGLNAAPDAEKRTSAVGERAPLFGATERRS